ncbi:MAG: segregation/condensation protein A [Armatimonadetes bacterium]|nr:segregation/condensation protein A [Armatimonadota bacterium]
MMKPMVMRTSTFPLQVRVPAFEGPLDLLLHLLRANQLDITDIPIAEITQQYLDTMVLWESLDLQIAGEYLVMAATLIEIKSRMLLPQPPLTKDDPDDDPRAELVQALIEYEKLSGVADELKRMEEERRHIFFRAATENPEDYALPVQLQAGSVEILVRALSRLLAQVASEVPTTTITPTRRITLRLKMAEIWRRIAGLQTEIPFEALFDTGSVLYDIVMTFLALLELVRQNKIQVVQDEIDGTIWLSRSGSKDDQNGHYAVVSERGSAGRAGVLQ